MLETLRNAANTWPFKVFLGLLLASFSFWGVESYLTGGTFSSYVIKVGANRIGVKEYDQAMQTSLHRMQEHLATTGQDKSFLKPLIPLLQQQVTQRLIQQKLLQEAAQDMGIVISDALIKKEIARQFTDDKGIFQAETFKHALRSLGMSEKQLVAHLKEEMARNMVAQAIFPGIHAPKMMVSPLVADYFTPRSFTLVTFTSRDIAHSPLPTTDQLKAFYQANKKRYLVPEKRSFEVLTIPLKGITPKENPPQGASGPQPTSTPDTKPDTRPDTRPDNSVPDYKRIQVVEDALASGASFQEVAKLHNLVLTSHGPISLKEGRENNLQKEQSAPGATKTTKEGKKGSKKGVKVGSSVSTTQSQGKQPGLHPLLIKAAFEQEIGVEGDTIEPPTDGRGNAYIVKVTEVAPAHVPDFEALMGTLTVDYRMQQQITLLKNKVEDIVPLLREKNLTLPGLGKLMKSKGTAITPQNFSNVLLVSVPQATPATKKSSEKPTSSPHGHPLMDSLPPQVKEAIARTAKSDYFGVVVGDKAYVGQVTEFGSISPENRHHGFTQVAEGVRLALTGMATRALFAEIEKDHPVVINEPLYQELAQHYAK